MEASKWTDSRWNYGLPVCFNQLLLLGYDGGAKNSSTF